MDEPRQSDDLATIEAFLEEAGLTRSSLGWGWLARASALRAFEVRDPDAESCAPPGGAP